MNDGNKKLPSFFLYICLFKQKVYTMEKKIIFHLNLNFFELIISEELEGMNIQKAEDQNNEIVDKKIKDLKKEIDKDAKEFLDEEERDDKFITINYFGNISPVEIYVSTIINLNFIRLKNTQDFFMEKEYKIYFK